jgi:hypothetical protein
MLWALFYPLFDVVEYFLKRKFIIKYKITPPKYYSKIRRCCFYLNSVQSSHIVLDNKNVITDICLRNSHIPAQNQELRHHCQMPRFPEVQMIVLVHAVS